jgi:antitoxin component of RelBE/YafQ-DinJ toxin-antitoxin module
VYNRHEGDEKMKNVNVTIRVDEDLKKQADSLFSEL